MKLHEKVNVREKKRQKLCTKENDDGRNITKARREQST
jgi:hypothetical protein